MNKFVSFLRRHSNVLVFICLLIGSGVFSHLLTNEYSIDGGRKQVALSAKLLLAFSYVLAFGLIALYWQEFKQKMTSIIWFWAALMLWALVSLVIGQFNINTIMRLVGLFGCTLIGLMLFVCTENVRQVVQQLFWVCFAIILINLFYLDLSVLMDTSARNIKGVFVQKNPLGQFSFLTMFVSGFAFTAFKEGGKSLSVILFVLAAWLLFLSTSMTSNLLLPIAGLAVLASLIIGSYRHGWLLVVGLSVFLAILLALNWFEFFSLIGKSTTFTGRTSHWREYWALIEQRMFVGHGYGAYPEKQTYWLMAGAHNGYIELIYQTGMVGLIIMLTIISLTLKKWWLIVKENSYIFEACFLFSFIVAYLILNLVETYMLHRSGFYWPLFIYVTLQVAFLNKQLTLKAKG